MSDGKDLNHYVPSRLDDKSKFLFWDADVAMCFLAFLIVGIITDHPIIGIVIGAYAAMKFKKVKAGKHPGLASHLSYWITGFPEPKELPPSYKREFNG